MQSTDVPVHYAVICEESGVGVCHVRGKVVDVGQEQ